MGNEDKQAGKADLLYQKQLRYKRVFSGEDGEIVLYDLLYSLGFYEHTLPKESPEVVMAKQYFARYILANLGAFENENLLEMTRKLARIEPTYKE